MSDTVANPNGSDTGTLMGGIIDDAQELLDQQIALLKSEVRRDLARARVAAPAVLAGIGFCFSGIVLLSLMIAHLLQWCWPSLPAWTSDGIVGVLLVGGGWCLTYYTVRQFSSEPLPVTVDALKENVEWKTNRK